MNKNERIKWAAAIAKRISDEWDGSKQFPEDAALLRGYLQKTLSKDGDAIKSFIGTGIIENDYFKKI
ncbi:MAG: hypothetical protein K9L60_05890 [Methylovulum sp.]|jgi:hypothetical protein|nr:hypothetical protein [Methylovulum sp.]MCF7998745.1 hypothetical protein [Methylovulum sp.]